MSLKQFSTMELEEALAHALAGGQSLHLHRVLGNRAKAPRCFVRAVDRGEQIAHLFDLDPSRLKATARRLGVRVLHIDLCGAPLRKALAMIAEGQADA